MEMDRVAYLDTHIAVWLHMGESGLIGKMAKARLKTHELRVSPIVLLELQYLFDTNKSNFKPKVIIDTLADSIGLMICQKDFGAIVNTALHQGWTRDPFDRIIVSQAALGHDTLITKDEKILQHYSKAIWD
jgi:PIN domain nuclease of toxin-antitoxin system